MSKIIPVSITTTEQTVTLDATYQFVWLRNMGENGCLLSDHSGIVAGDDNVTLVKAGESGRIATSGRAVYIKTVSGTSTGEIHAQNFSDVPFKSKAKGGGQTITVEPLTVTDNGVYTAPTGKAYSPVTVDVQDQPWQPLEDGYSNFWFELTNDTLSPWLNFSAKNDNAVIDWGDGSGEQALTTLTPTHTYAKAGRYVVKCKGVTRIAAQGYVPYTAYSNVLKAIELNSDITTVDVAAFNRAMKLENVVFSNTITTIGSVPFGYCASLSGKIVLPPVDTISTNCFALCLQLKEIEVAEGTTTIMNNAFYYNVILNKVKLPSTLTSIGSAAFAYCLGMQETHIAATTPPTLGTNALFSLPPDYIIYVPVGYGDTYKAASGWSTYADHILEEGQTPNRMMLAKFNSAKTDEPQDDMR